MAWWNRLLYFGIPALLMLVIVLGFNSGPFLMRPMSSDDDVEARLEEVCRLAVDGSWAEASRAAEALDAAWQKVRSRVHFALNVAEVEQFDVELAGLQGAVEARDVAEVRIGVRRLRRLWENFSP